MVMKWLIVLLAQQKYNHDTAIIKNRELGRNFQIGLPAEAFFFLEIRKLRP